MMSPEWVCTFVRNTRLKCRKVCLQTMRTNRTHRDSRSRLLNCRYVFKTHSVLPWMFGQRECLLVFLPSIHSWIYFIECCAQWFHVCSGSSLQADPQQETAKLQCGSKYMYFSDQMNQHKNPNIFPLKKMSVSFGRVNIVYIFEKCVALDLYSLCENWIEFAD